MRVLADTLRAQAAALRSVADALDAQADLAEREPEADPFVTGGALGINATTWRRVCRTGELPAVLLGRAYVARRSDVEKWLATKRVDPCLDTVRPARMRNRSPVDDGERQLDEMERLLLRVRGANGRAERA